MQSQKAFPLNPIDGISIKPSATENSSISNAHAATTQLKKGASLTNPKCEDAFAKGRGE